MHLFEKSYSNRTVYIDRGRHRGGIHSASNFRTFCSPCRMLLCCACLFSLSIGVGPVTRRSFDHVAPEGTSTGRQSRLRPLQAAFTLDSGSPACRQLSRAGRSRRRGPAIRLWRERGRDMTRNHRHRFWLACPPAPMATHNIGGSSLAAPVLYTSPGCSLSSHLLLAGIP